MPDDEKPNPLEDLRKGLGLLFRAAKTTIEKLPTGELEEAVVTGAKEVGRAIENVAHTVEQQVLRKPSVRTPSEAPPAKPDDEASKPADDAKDAPK
ncbi:MAG: hypothetical protein ACLQVI_01040 [Polyangiaceae bacterium]|jgi:hypothetical protein